MTSYNSFAEMSELLDGINLIGHAGTALLVIFIVFGLIILIPFAFFRFSLKHNTYLSTKEEQASAHLVYLKTSIMTILVFFCCCWIVDFIFVIVLGIYPTLGETLNKILMLNLINS